MTDIIPAVQQQSINDSLIELFELDINGISDTIYLTSGIDANAKNLYFPTEDGTALKEYIAIPISIGNIEITSDGPQNRPTLTVANLISLGRTISNNQDGNSDETTWATILQQAGVTKPEDIVGSTLVYRRTLLKNTYRVEDVTGWTTTLPKEFPKSKYILDRVTGETGTIVTFELTSPFDVEGVKIPGRILIGKYCPWEYQGIAISGDERSGCTWAYTESAQVNYYDINDSPIDMGTVSVYSSSASYSPGALVSTTDSGTNRYRIWVCINSKPAGVSADPRTAKAYWERYDLCGKTLSACKARFQGPTENRLIPLPFGGFPGSRKFR